MRIQVDPRQPRALTLASEADGTFIAEDVANKANTRGQGQSLKGEDWQSQDCGITWYQTGIHLCSGVRKLGKATASSRNLRDDLKLAWELQRKRPAPFARVPSHCPGVPLQILGHGGGCSSSRIG